MLTISVVMTISLHAQNIIVESFYPNQNRGISIQHNFDRSNYEREIMPDGSSTFLKKKQNENKAPMNKLDISLTLVFKYETGIQYPYMAYVVNETHEYSMHIGNDTIVQAIDEAGTYDVFTNFKIFGKSASQAYVIKELVDIHSDTTITVNIAEAENHIVAEVYNENGELTEPGEWINDTTFIDNGNIRDMLFHRFIKSDWFEYSLAANKGNRARIFDFYISDISNRYTVAELKLTLGKEKNGFYLNKFILNSGIYASDTLRNNPDNFLMHEEFFKLTPESNSQRNWSISSNSIVNGKERSGWMCYFDSTFYLEGEGMKVYLDNQLSDSQTPNRMDMLALPGVVEKLDTIEDKNSLVKGNLSYDLVPYITYGPSIALDENRELKYLAHPSGYFARLCDGGGTTLPEHPAFSFINDDNNPVLNADNCPMYFCNLLFYEETGIKYNYFELMSKGRYGEIRDIDNKYVNAQVKYNSDIVYEGIGSTGIVEFTYQWASEGHPDGFMEINLTNDNVEVDGIEGQNLTTISFDQSKEDWLPPQLQMLQFRNVSGKVTDRFTLPDDGIVELAAGDFDYSWDNGCFSFKEGNVVECYYAPTGSSSWTSLDLTIMPEYFWHGFGDFYQASLSSIQQTGIDVWYDLKIVCTDAAGNSMKQTISPAFKILNNVSVEEPGQSNHTSDIQVYPNPVKDVLTVNYSGNMPYSINILNTLGNTVYNSPVTCSKIENINLKSLNLSDGIYIIQLIDNNKNAVHRKITYKK